MKRLIQTPVLAAALATACAIACKSPEASPSTTATAEPAKTSGEPAAPKATDPESVRSLVLDPAASKFDFVAAKITKSHNGAFKQLSGAATVVGEELQSVAVEVDTASTEADDPKLTGHLKSPDFLDVQKFPKATFKSHGITRKAAGGATHEVTGDLTLHGVTQSLTFPATISITPTGVTATAEVRIDRQKFGVAYPGMPDDLIKDEVVLKPQLVFVKK